MQAVILAAGMGKRLGELTKLHTKGMIPLHGRTLLERSLDILAAAKVDRIVLVVGYRQQEVRRTIGDIYEGVPVTYVENKDYDTTNNIYSLYLARDLLEEDDTLLLESDIVYEAGIIDALLSHPAPNVAVVDRYRSWMDGTVVTLAPDDTIQRFVPKKHFDGNAIDSYFKTVNIYRFSRSYLLRSYIPFLEAYVRAVGNNEYYEQVLRVVTTLEQQDLVAMPLTGEKWYEIDDLQDLRNAETVFAPVNAVYDSYLSRHGGYWRFPELRDFCYLVNPYFPPREMLDEMRRSFDTLLCEYPSGAAVQDHLSARMFDCPPSLITTGNGAAELIALLGRELPIGRVGVPVPTFEEYIKRFPGAEVVTLAASPPDFLPSLGALEALADETDALVLVNPDNPSGQCLAQADVLELARYLSERGKRLILDESFVDFAEPDHCTSLIRPDVLTGHPGLVIVKSISKSYGVPGSRLGVLATADAALLERIRDRASVWNVNSFGEFFMQAFGKYQNRYAQACERLRTERSRFHASLSQVPGVRVLPSHANYFLCEVAPHLSATELAHRLLRDFAILVKDCSAKPGLQGGGFVRVAVRDRADNDYFVSAITEVMADVS